jgi:hypothetical protein
MRLNFYKFGLASLILIILGFDYYIIYKARDSKQEIRQNLSHDGYIIKEIDSCEYFMVHVSSYSDGGGFLPVHKHNCRFCKERKEKGE